MGSKQTISTQTTEDSFPKLSANEFAENEAHPEQNLIKVYIDVYIYSLLSNMHILKKIYQGKKEPSTYTMANEHSGKEGNYKTKNSKKKTDKRDTNIIAN